MISGLSAFQAAIAAPDPLKSKSVEPPARDVLPRPGIDTLQLSRRGQGLANANPGGFAARRGATASGVRTFANGVEVTAQGARAAAVVRGPDGQTVEAGRATATVKIAQGEGPAITATRTVSMISTTNANGVQTYQRVQSMQIDKPTPQPIRPAEPASMMNRMRSAFFTASGDKGYDSGLDLNSDGQINFGDLKILEAKLEASQNTTAVLAAGPQDTEATILPVGALPPEKPVELPGDQADPLIAIRQAFFTSAGEQGFDASADLNGDGQVDFADLAEL